MGAPASQLLDAIVSTSDGRDGGVGAAGGGDPAGGVGAEGGAGELGAGAGAGAAAGGTVGGVVTFMGIPGFIRQHVGFMGAVLAPICHSWPSLHGRGGGDGQIGYGPGMEQIWPRKTYLFTPGPTPVPDRVLAAMAVPVIHHRTPQWQATFGRVLQRLPRLFGTTSPVAMFAASGSGAMESAVSNLVRPGDEVCVAAFGKFGQRWGDIARSMGAIVHQLDLPWGERPDVDAIGQFAAAHPAARVVMTTHSETSTGTVSDAAAIARSVRAQCSDDRLLVLDAISSVGAIPVEMDAWGYDVVVAGSQKALMIPPGLSFAAVSQRALDAAGVDADRAAAGSPRFYFDWGYTLAKQRTSPPSTVFTPALTLVNGLDVALDILFEEGMDAVFQRHVQLGRATRAAAHALGLTLFGPDDDSSSVVTAVSAPDGIDGSALPKLLRDSYGVTIAGGQGELKGKIFRIGHCGWVNALDMVLAIAAIERGLVELGADIEVGAGVAAAQRVLVAEVVS